MKTCTALLFVSLVLGFVCTSVKAEHSPAEELDAALKRLEGTTYRKHEQVCGRMAAAMKGPPMVTEVSGDRTRLVAEMEIPGHGKIRQERITVGERAAVRVSAPAISQKLESAKRKMTVASARSILSQLASVAMALQTGGLSAADLLLQGASTAMSIKTTAQAKAALDQASESFDRWQLVKEDVEEDDLSFPAPSSGTDANEFMTVEKQQSKDAKVIRYTRRMKETMPGAGAFYSVYFVDSATGLLMAEETFVQGERIMRAEYADIGAPIEIELPECLK